jgi:hypothetical protein
MHKCRVSVQHFVNCSSYEESAGGRNVATDELVIIQTQTVVFELHSCHEKQRVCLLRGTFCPHSVENAAHALWMVDN